MKIQTVASSSQEASSTGSIEDYNEFNRLLDELEGAKVDAHACGNDFGTGDKHQSAYENLVNYIDSWAAQRAGQQAERHRETGGGLTIGEAFKAVGGWMNGGELGYPSFGSMNALFAYTVKMVGSARDSILNEAATAAETESFPDHIDRGPGDRYFKLGLHHAADTIRLLKLPASQNAEPHTDDQAVDRFAAAMREKMASARAKGRSGWNDRESCSADHLNTMLAAHLAKGDPVDIGNFAMMLWNRGDRTSAPGTPEALSEPLAWAALDLNGAIVYQNASRENVDTNRRYIKTPTRIVGLIAQLNGGQEDKP